MAFAIRTRGFKRLFESVSLIEVESFSRNIHTRVNNNDRIWSRFGMTAVLKCNANRGQFLHKALYYTKPKKRGPSSQAWMVVLGSSVTMLGAAIFFFGQPDEGLDGKIMIDEFSKEMVVKAYLLRCWHRMKEVTKMYTDPAHETLLPAPLPHHYQPPYTLIIEMKDILVHSEYDRSEGWRLRKRPGVDYLLRSLAGTYEIVLFTSELPYVAEPVVAKLDPEGIIMYHLYRDSTKYESGVHIKDLTNLNRDLSRVIIVDTDPKSFSYQSNNGLVLKEWTGDQQDTTLFDLAHFLKGLADHRVVDVRPVLDHYKNQGGDVLVTFRINQAKLSEEERKRGTEKNKTSPGQRWGGIRWSR